MLLYYNMGNLHLHVVNMRMEVSRMADSVPFRTPESVFNRTAERRSRPSFQSDRFPGYRVPDPCWWKPF